MRNIKIEKTSEQWMKGLSERHTWFRVLNIKALLMFILLEEALLIPVRRCNPKKGRAVMYEILII